MSQGDRVIRRVLVPLDGSETSEQALGAAARVARRTGASVRLVHVLEPEEDPGTYPESLTGSSELDGLDVHARVLNGEPRDALLKETQDWDADLVVMTSRGRGGIKRALLGSVADQLVRESRVPILLVRPHEAADVGGVNSASSTEYVRVLVPLTGQPESELILPHVLALTGTDSVHYELLRILPLPVDFERPSSGRILGGPQLTPDDAYLSTLAGKLSDRGVLTSIRAPERGEPADAILRLAADGEVDLIAMTTRGLGGLDRAIFGSTADQVLRKASCAVLVVRGDAEGATDSPPG